MTFSKPILVHLPTLFHGCSAQATRNIGQTPDLGVRRNCLTNTPGEFGYQRAKLPTAGNLCHLCRNCEPHLLELERPQRARDSATQLTSDMS